VRRFVLRFLFLQLVERIFRTEQFLQSAEHDRSASSARVVAVFKNHLSVTLRNAKRWVARLDEGPLDDEVARLVLRQLSLAYSDFDELHLRLGYVGGRWSGSDIELFVKAVFGSTAPLMQHAPSVNVVPSDRFMFEETTLDFAVAAHVGRATSEDTSPTVLLPKIEFSNPLNWCPLVHEFGHTLYKRFRADMPATITAADPSARRLAESSSPLLENWLEEMFCDLLATKLLGPAYAASFVDFVVGTAASENLEAATLTHPDVRFRVTAMGEAMRTDGVVARFQTPIAGCADLFELATTLFEERADLGRNLLNESDNTIEDVPRAAKAFRRRIIEEIDGMVPRPLRVAPLEARRIQSLHQRLGRDIPVASYRESEFDPDVRVTAETALNGVDAFVEQKPGIPLDARTRALLVHVTSAITEQPCSVAEILNAAWLYKWERIYAPFIERHSRSDAKEIPHFKTSLLRLDAVTRTSIETAYLAREFRAYADAQ
jgi:hypothetical protein